MSHDEHHDEEQDRPRIKVTDRRLFDRDGNPRDPDPEPAESSVPPVPEAEVGSTGGPAPQATAESESTGPRPTPRQPAPPQAPAQAQAPAGKPAPAKAEALRVSSEALLQFVEEQYMMGMIALGAMPHPQTGEPEEDLEMAHLRIAMLEALDERTASTRGPQEAQIFEDALYRMRMLYLQKRKVAKL